MLLSLSILLQLDPCPNSSFIGTVCYERMARTSSIERMGKVRDRCPFAGPGSALYGRVRYQLLIDIDHNPVIARLGPCNRKGEGVGWGMKGRGRFEAAK